MTRNLGLILIIAGVAGVTIAIIAYQVARFLRGSLKLVLQRTSFQPGEIISGSLNLLAKKPITGHKLTVSLIGVETTKTNYNGKPQSHTREIYRDEVLVEDARTYSAGYQARYDFKIAAANASQPEFMNPGMGQVLASAARILSNTRSTIQWRIEARLHAKGVDLAATQRITISRSSII